MNRKYTCVASDKFGVSEVQFRLNSGARVGPVRVYDKRQREMFNVMSTFINIQSGGPFQHSVS